MDEPLLNALDRIGKALEESVCYQAAQYRLAQRLTEHNLESEARAEERSEALAAVTLRRAEETHESHELGMSLLGQRTPDSVPEEWQRPNREQRRKARRR